MGVLSAQRIVRQRKMRAVRYEDLKKIGVVLKRARYFLTCSGRYYGEKKFAPEFIRDQILERRDGVQLSMFAGDTGRILSGRQERPMVQSHG